MLSFLLRVKSPAPAHSLRSTSGEKRKIRHAEIQLQQKPKKKRKKEGYSCSFTINAKALCLSEKSIFPSVLHCTKMAGVSAYQSVCYHGGKEKKKLQLYMYMLFVLCWVTVCDCCYFPPQHIFQLKLRGGRFESRWGRENSHPGNRPSMEQ